MLLDLLMATGGLVILIAGAWVVVRSAVLLALSYGISRVVVGATVVAFGTSAPEFIVSLLAGIRDSPGIALGNVLGSNVTNVALVLGLGALINPVRVQSRLLRWEIPVLLAATAALLLAAASGVIGRLEGIVLFIGLLAFTLLSPFLFPDAASEIEAESPAAAPPRGLRTLAVQGALLLLGLGALALGAQLTVEGATGLAEQIGMSELVIGVTIIAVGTSLPELATTVVAAVRNEHEIAAANVIGSNIFNLLGVLGLTAAITGLEVDRDLYRFEFPVLAVSALILLPMIWPGSRITRPEGALLLALYIAFTVVVVARG